MQQRAAILALALLLAAPFQSLGAGPNPGGSVSGSDVEPPMASEGLPSGPPTPASPPVDPTASPGSEPLPETGPEPSAGGDPPGETGRGGEPPPGAAPGAARPGSPDGAGSPDVADRWIVVLEDGEDVADDVARHGRALGVRADRVFRTVVRGYAATLTPGQVDALRATHGVRAVVPDGIVSIAGQYVPTGVRRVNATTSVIAAIDGEDERVDADIAVVDTGIDADHPDLNVVGGINCTTDDPGAWTDDHGHGTHVAGIAAAKDNGGGVVGVAPGARLWSIRILDADGMGRISWYVCGLDWVAAQRDPADADRPLIEAVNMSVARSGRDDGACGSVNDDLMHAAVCRVVAAGIPVVVAAGNASASAASHVPAAYNEVITVSALADTDGRPGGQGGSLCYSWGGYDQDDTFADFSNYGYDVDLIAPGKCIYSTLPGGRYGYMSGTSMATPAVTGAVALYKASRPVATPGEVRTTLRALGTFDWAVSTDPDATHEPLLDVSRIVAVGDFTVLAASPDRPVGEAGGDVRVPIEVVRSEGFDATVELTATAPTGFRTRFADPAVAPTDGSTTTLTVSVPRGTPPGQYPVTVTGSGPGGIRSAAVGLVVEGDRPTVTPPLVSGNRGSTFGTTWFIARAWWAPATDATSAITAYQVQWQVDGGAWGPTTTLPGTAWRMTGKVRVGHTYGVRIRASDEAGNWSDWAESTGYRFQVVQDRSSTIRRTGTWRTSWASWASGGTMAYGTRRWSSLTYDFTGRGIFVVLPKGPTRGEVRIYVDGELVAVENCYRRRTAGRVQTFYQAWDAWGAHTIRLVVLGTSGHPRVDLDAFVVVK